MNNKKPSSYSKIKPEITVYQISDDDNEIMRNLAIAYLNLQIAEQQLSAKHAQNDRQREYSVEAIRKARVGIDNVNKLENPANIINVMISSIRTKDRMMICNVLAFITYNLYRNEILTADKYITEEKNNRTN